MATPAFSVLTRDGTMSAEVISVLGARGVIRRTTSALISRWSSRAATSPAGPQELSRSEAPAKVYGATPSSDAKEKPTHRRKHRGGVRMNGRRSPSGEPPEASGAVASRTEQPTNHVERSEG